MLKKVLPILLLSAIMVISVSLSYATLTQNWRVNSNTSWYGQSAQVNNNTRGMCYNPATDHVLVALRTTPGRIIIVNAFDGTSTGSLDTSAIAGSPPAGLEMDKVKAGPYGTIFACCLNNNSQDSTTTFYMYRWQNEASTSAVIYRNRQSSPIPEPSPIGPQMPSVPYNISQRIGDSMDVAYSGSTVDIYVSSMFGSSSVVVYDFHSIDTGLSISTVFTLIPTGQFGTSPNGRAGGICVDGFNGNLYVMSTGIMAVWSLTNGVSTSGSNVTLTSIVTCSNALNSAELGSIQPSIRSLNGRTYMGMIDKNAYSGQSATRGILVDITYGPTSASVIEFTDSLSTPSTNNSGPYGDFDVDTTRGRFLYLVTNNFVGSYSLASSTTKTWSGSGDGTNWYNASNWSPSGIPTGSDDVILDHSIVSGAYTVSIGVGDNTTKTCRTLTVGDGGNLITVDIANSTANALNVAGTQSTNSTILVRNGGRFLIRSTFPANNGDTLYNRNFGNLFSVLSGGYSLLSTDGNFSTPCPATGDGAISWASGATHEYNLPTNTVPPLNGRTFGNLILNAPVTRTYTVTNNSQTIIQNDFTVGSNVTFSQASGNGTFNIRGNVNINGPGATFGSVAGMQSSVVFDGSASQTISGTGTLSMVSATINNSAGLVLSRNVTITSTLNMISGNINTGSNYLTLGASGVAGNLIHTSGAVIGNIICGVPNSTGSVVFPVGTASNYNEASISFTVAPTAGVATAFFTGSNPGDVGLPVTDGTTTYTDVANEGYWTINCPDSSGTYNLTLKANGFTLPATNISILKRVTGSGTWAGSVSGVAGGYSFPSITRTGYSGFSEFGISGDATLPIELSNFKSE